MPRRSSAQHCGSFLTSALASSLIRMSRGTAVGCRAHLLPALLGVAELGPLIFSCLSLPKGTELVLTLLQLRAQSARQRAESPWFRVS